MVFIYGSSALDHYDDAHCNVHFYQNGTISYKPTDVISYARSTLFGGLVLAALVQMWYPARPAEPMKRYTDITLRLGALVLIALAYWVTFFGLLSGSCSSSDLTTNEEVRDSKLFAGTVSAFCLAVPYVNRVNVRVYSMHKQKKYTIDLRCTSRHPRLCTFYLLIDIVDVRCSYSHGF